MPRLRSRVALILRRFLDFKVSILIICTQLSTAMEGHRKNAPTFDNLPEYTGPGLPTKARNLVKLLTEVPDNALESIDANVMDGTR
jgi:hypothetical protein